MQQLTRPEARRIAVRAQLLAAERPASLAETVERLTFLQLDPTSAIAPSADLVAWSRIGEGYRPADLKAALDGRLLFERTCQEVPTEPGVAKVRPMADLHLYLADMAAARPGAARGTAWLEANDAFRKRVLDQLRAEGPLQSRDIEDTAVEGWQSTGWTHDRNVTMMLEFLLVKGEVAIAGREGRQRVWDVADRVYPAVEPLPRAEAHRIRDERRLRYLGVARPKMVGDAGVPATIEGTAGEWRLDPAAEAGDFRGPGDLRGAGDFRGRTALLSPFDRLIHDRKRALEIFEFEYTLEMYKPAAQRRWGYFALPVLHGDRLVGKVDAVVDVKRSVLVVNAVHEDVEFTKAVRDGVAGELDSMGRWLGVGEVVMP